MQAIHHNIMRVLFLLNLFWVYAKSEDVSHSNVEANINEFGFKLTKEIMSKNEQKNVVISPSGITGLLAMTLLGSTGNTYDELSSALGFSNDILQNRQNHLKFGESLQALSSFNNSSESSTVYGNAVFVDDHTKIRQLYRSYLTRVYKGDVLITDFGDTVNSKKAINNWVKANTNGKINEFLKESLPSDTDIVLLSALFFSEQWKHPFLPEYTKKMTFNTTEKVVFTELMLNFGEFKHFINEDFHMVALPYNDSVTTLYALKPLRPKKQSLKELLDNLDYKKIDSAIDESKISRCVIRFPKMQVQKRFNLEEYFRSLGIKSMFVPKDANFALMVDSDGVIGNKSEEDLLSRFKNGEIDKKETIDLLTSLKNPGIYVSTVLHDVRINIDEFGTEAVAATAGILAKTAEQFYADSPFLMFIRNEKTKLITFMAAIYDPTE